MMKWRKESILDIYNLVLGAFLFVSPWLAASTHGVMGEEHRERERFRLRWPGDPGFGWCRTRCVSAQWLADAANGIVLNASTSREVDAAFAIFMRARPDALFVGGDGFFTSRRVQLTHLATHRSIPATYGSREIAEVGGLMSYGSNIADAWRQVGVYAGRLLKGAKPADLPVVQASKFELVINAQTARMLGLDVPPMLLARADEVIE